jgi:cytochrome c553
MDSSWFTRVFISGIVLLSGIVHAEGLALNVPDTMAARLRACAACHGRQGEGSSNGYFPRLAGQPADYLYQQLKYFRAGERKYLPMNVLLTYLDDHYLRKIAVYYATATPSALVRHTVASPLAVAGRDLALQGDAARNVPACVACHGATLTGMQPAIPGLAGLDADYISAQLGAWRTGIRHAQPPDCMQHIAMRLSASEIAAVANWLSMQPPPRDLAPMPRQPQPLPLSCGSAPD